MPASRCSSRRSSSRSTSIVRWVSEDATRGLRRTLEDIQEDASDAGAAGKHAAMAVAEAEPIGGFVGMAISEPLLQIGILVSVIGYMTYLEPWALALSAGFLLPQMLFVPVMQRAINRRAEKRIRVLRRVSGDIVESWVCRRTSASSASSSSTWASTRSSIP